MKKHKIPYARKRNPRSRFEAWMFEKYKSAIIGTTMADKRQALKWLLDGHKIRNDKLKHDMFFYLDDYGEIRDEHNELCEFNSLWFEGYHIYNPEPEYDPKEVELNSDPLIDSEDILYLAQNNINQASDYLDAMQDNSFEYAIINAIEHIILHLRNNI